MSWGREGDSEGVKPGTGGRAGVLGAAFSLSPDWES